MNARFYVPTKRLVELARSQMGYEGKYQRNSINPTFCKVTVVTKHYKNEDILIQLTINLDQNTYVLRKNDTSHNRYSGL